MCETTIVVTADGRVCGVHSWTGGFVPLKCPRKPVTQDTVLEFAVHLERRGLRDEADFLLSRFLAGYKVELA
jgi:hypothetical protein